MKVALTVNDFLRRAELVYPERVAIVDDFLAGGRTAEALGEIAEEAGCTVLGTVFVIEKTYTEGRGRLEAHGWPVWALVQVESLANGEVRLAP